MKSMNRILLTGALLVAGAAFATTSIVRSQEGGDVDIAAMMAEMMKLATPGPEHKALAGMEGAWEQTYRFRMSPDAEWTDGAGTSKVTTLLGGRYVMQETKMSMMGMEMEGMHMLGFDNMKQEYISLWADSMSTWWITSRGKAAPDGKIETKGTMIDVAGERPFRMVIEPRADGSVYSEMFDTMPAGETKVMEITAKKK